MGSDRGPNPVCASIISQSSHECIQLQCSVVVLSFYYTFSLYLTLIIVTWSTGIILYCSIRLQIVLFFNMIQNDEVYLCTV